MLPSPPKSIEDIKPVPFTEFDRKEIKKDIFYTTFRNGIIWTSAVASLFLILFFLTHKFDWKFYIELRDVAVVFSAGIVATTCFYNAQSLRFNIEANEKKLKFDYDKAFLEQEQKKEDSKNKKLFEKRLYAYEVCKYVVTSEMTVHLQKARLFFLKDPLYKELKTISSADDLKLKDWSHRFDLCPERGSVILVLNYFEQIAIAIKEDFVDEDVVKNSLKTLIRQYYLAYKNYIDYRQRDQISGSATFLSNFEVLAVKWSDGQLKI